MAFRTSVGDNEIGDYFPENSQETSGSLTTLVWFVWAALMIIGNVVFFNFIVAVVSESYEKSMQTSKTLQYKMKCDMIKEIETIMSPQQKADTTLFPKYLVYRRALASDYEGQEEWQGFVKDIKASQARNYKSLKDQLRQQEAKTFYRMAGL